MLDLTVDHNFKKGPKFHIKQNNCYEGNTIVYGNPHSYQVDILLDEYKKLKIRNGRQYRVAIIDEVDSMFVDEKNHQTLLATTYAGFS